MFENPHRTRYAHYYASPIAEKALHMQARRFPTGAVLVKEKRGHDGKSVEAVAGMIKRSQGYDPAHGDWEYFFTNPAGEFTSGRLESCVQCHSHARAEDFVYKGWQE